MTIINKKNIKAYNQNLISYINFTKSIFTSIITHINKCNSAKIYHVTRVKPCLSIYLNKTIPCEVLLLPLLSIK